MNLFKLVKPIVEKVPIIAELSRFLRDRKSVKNEILYRENLGFFFNGNTSMENGEFEPNETKIIESLLTSFDLFVNIGANTGYYVCRALNKNIPTIAFEPNQLNTNFLLRNVRANNFESNFLFFPVALGNQCGILPMFGSSTGASLIEGWNGQKNSYLVPIFTFDKIAQQFVENKSCLVLLDIEGAEFDCLKGCYSILSSKNNNIFLIEISMVEHQPSRRKINPNLLKTFNLMSDYGYTAFTADSKLRKVDLKEVAEIESSYVNTFQTHNFLFTKNEKVLQKIKF